MPRARRKVILRGLSSGALGRRRGRAYSPKRNSKRYSLGFGTSWLFGKRRIWKRSGRAGWWGN